APVGCTNYATCGAPNPPCCTNFPRPFIITQVSVAETTFATNILTAPANIQIPTINRWYGTKAFGINYNPDDVAIWNTSFLNRYPDLPQGTEAAILTVSSYDGMYAIAN